MGTWLTNLWYKTVFNQKLLFGYFNTPPLNGPSKNGYKLVFSDEFTKPIDWNKWSEIEPWEQWNPRGIYQKSQVTQQGSSAYLTSIRKNGKLVSGLLDTWKSFTIKYCFAEIRMKVPPKTENFWPCFWCYDPNGWLPEIDIAEFQKGKGSEYTATQHDKETSPGYHEQRGIRISGIDFTKEFHTFGMEWTSSKITFYLDNLPIYLSTTNIPNVPFHFLVSMGGITTLPDSAFPGTLEVDYFRIFSKI